jgi:hypothetical protein
MQLVLILLALAAVCSELDAPVLGLTTRGSEFEVMVRTLVGGCEDMGVKFEGYMRKELRFDLQPISWATQVTHSTHAPVTAPVVDLPSCDCFQLVIAGH